MMEDEARDFYALAHNVEPYRIGFIKRETAAGVVGCSPDSLVLSRTGRSKSRRKCPAA